MTGTEKITTTEKAREAFNQMMIGEHDTANRLLKDVLAETRARRIVLQAAREARERAQGGKIPDGPRMAVLRLPGSF